MSDIYQSVSHRSFGDNLLESIKGFLIGIVLFFAAFPVLWMNEGCVDLSTVAKKAVVVPADGSGTKGEGELVAVTDKLKATESVGDPEMLAPGPYLKLRRNVEMFAWTEKKQTRTEKQLGGGSKEITTYTYDRAWTSSPRSSDSFEHPEGHSNPELYTHEQTFSAASAKVGGFTFSPEEAQLPSLEPLTLTAAMVKLAPAHDAEPPAPAASSSAKAPPGKKVFPVKPAASAKPVASAKPAASAKKPAEPAGDEGDEPATDEPPPHVGGPFHLVSGVLFQGVGTPENPKLGDVRVTFSAVTDGQLVTLYGTRKGTEVVTYLHEGKDKLFRVVPGTHEEAIAALHNEHQTILWAFRGIGFFMIWVGLALVFAPLNSVLDIVPFVGGLGRFITGIAMLPIAMVLAGVTILVAIVAHNPILLGVVVVGMIGIAIAVVVMRKNAVARRQPGVARG